MPIPDYQSCMLPLLRFASDGQEHQPKEAAQKLATEFKLSAEEISEFLPSGQQPVFINRIGWARTYLKKAGLLRNPRRGYFQITGRGMATVKENPPEVNVKYLERFPEFLEFRASRKDDAVEGGGGQAEPDSAPTQTPMKRSKLHMNDFAQSWHRKSFKRLNRLIPHCLKTSSSSFSYEWDTVDPGRTPGRPSAVAGTKELTELSRRTTLASTISIFRQSDGEPQ